MEHFYRKIQGWFTFAELYDFALAHCPDTGHIVEVGCWKGRSSAYMAVSIINSEKNIKFDVIDPFIPLESAKCGADPISHKDLKNLFINNMKPVKGRYSLFVASSPQICSNYVDNSLDFVFIDGDHFRLAEDIKGWMPKIKTGGYIAGHDYTTFPSVKKACQDVLGNENWADMWGCLSWIAKKTNSGFVKIGT